jgi:hypothetical protein
MNGARPTASPAALPLVTVARAGHVLLHVFLRVGRLRSRAPCKPHSSGAMFSGHRPGIFLHLGQLVLQVCMDYRYALSVIHCTAWPHHLSVRGHLPNIFHISLEPREYPSGMGLSLWHKVVDNSRPVTLSTPHFVQILEAFDVGHDVTNTCLFTRPTATHGAHCMLPFIFNMWIRHSFFLRWRHRILGLAAAIMPPSKLLSHSVLPNLAA